MKSDRLVIHTHRHIWKPRAAFASKPFMSLPLHGSRSTCRFVAKVPAVDGTNTNQERKRPLEKMQFFYIEITNSAESRSRKPVAALKLAKNLTIFVFARGGSRNRTRRRSRRRWKGRLKRITKSGRMNDAGRKRPQREHGAVKFRQPRWHQRDQQRNFSAFLLAVDISSRFCLAALPTCILFRRGA